MKYELGKSKIQGLGIISTESINKDESIDIAIDFLFNFFPVITDYIGRWVNHSTNNNIYLYFDGKKYYFKASKFIPSGSELLLDYNDTPWYIMKPMPWYI